MDSPYLQRIGPFLRSPKQTTNILIIGEAFAENDRPLFERITTEMREHFLNVTPFNLFQDRLAFFRAFVPSVNSGVSGDFDIDQYGYPMGMGNKGPSIGRLADKNTALGFSYKIVRKRLNLETSKGDDSVLKFIAELGELENDPDSDIPQCWLKGGRNHGLVYVIVNDDPHAGHSCGDYVIVSRYVRNRFYLRDDLADPIRKDASNRILHDPDPNADVDSKKLAWVMAHEFGHSYFNLKDEYLDTDYYDDSSAQQDGLEASENLITKRQIDSGDIDHPTVKWLDQGKLIYPPDPETGLAPVASLVMGQVFNYMFPGNGSFRPLKKNPDSALKHSGKEEKPDSSFWDTYKTLKKCRYSSRIIGLYEGAVSDSKNTFRPAGNCIMRMASSSLAISSAPLMSLPQLKQPLESVDPFISYNTTEHPPALEYRGTFIKPDYKALQQLSDDPSYLDALSLLYERSKELSNRGQTDLPPEFCYICTCAIIKKLEPEDMQKQYELLKKISQKYPFLEKK